MILIFENRDRNRFRCKLYGVIFYQLKEHLTELDLPSSSCVLDKTKEKERERGKNQLKMKLVYFCDL